jgi:hypothetical protein
MRPLKGLQAQGLAGNKHLTKDVVRAPLVAVPRRSLFLTTIKPFTFHSVPSARWAGPCRKEILALDQPLSSH